MFRLFSVNFTFNVLNYKKLLIFDKSPSKIILFILHVQVVSFQFEELIVCVVTDCRLGLIVFSQTSGFDPYTPPNTVSHSYDQAICLNF